jgi:para-aminobenzoate synthetase/4-amino-4-deoxychorismate lyase
MLNVRGSIPRVAGSDPQIDFACAPRPDVAAGVFETLLVVDGRAVEARRHLERLAASVRALYGTDLAPDLDAQVARAADGHVLGRLRVAVVPPARTPTQVGVLAPHVDVVPFDPSVVLARAEVPLVVVRVVAGFGPHKLIDRAWLEQIESLAGEGMRALLVSGSGALLETTRANVFLLRDGELATPPLDGSILPGVMRAVLLEQARRLGIATREAPLTVGDLRDADMVLFCNSLALIERARTRSGGRSARAAARLAQALELWGLGTSAPGPAEWLGGAETRGTS